MDTFASGNFIFRETAIAGVLLVDTKRFEDSRGFFSELYKRTDFTQVGIEDVFIQENYSFSVRGALRGIHYQIEHPQSKLIRVHSGEILDVAVDLRPNSITFGNWFGTHLSGDNGRQLYIPHGCGHGLVVLSESAKFSYLADDVYHPNDEGGIIWNDPTLSIDWVMEHKAITLSEKDSVLPSFLQVFGS